MFFLFKEGIAEDQYRKGKTYLDKAIGHSENYVKALEFFKKAACNDHALAQYQLGLLYFRGVSYAGIHRNYEEAVKWFSLAAEQGLQSAQIELGNCYYNGNGVPQNYDKAEIWYERAADHGNKCEQYKKIGDNFYEGNGVDMNYDEAFKWYKFAAELGDIDAQNKIATSYFYGIGTSRKYEEAVRWYLNAAKQDSSEAQFTLGNCYYNGKGIPRNYEEAMKWYHLAAGQGHQYAQLYLGHCYFYGKGVDQNYTEAFKWYKIAGDNGLAVAHFFVGKCYYYGTGVSQNINEALNWFNTTANRHDTISKQKREEIKQLKAKNDLLGRIVDNVDIHLMAENGLALDDVTIYIGKRIRDFEEVVYHTESVRKLKHDDNGGEDFANLSVIENFLSNISIKDGYELNCFTSYCDPEEKYKADYKCILYVCLKRAGQRWVPTEKLNNDTGLVYNEEMFLSGRYDSSDIPGLKPIIDYFNVPFSSAGIIDAWLLTISSFYLPMTQKNRKIFISDIDNIRELFHVDYGLSYANNKKTAEYIDLVNRINNIPIDDILPHLQINGNMAIMTYSYWLEEKGLIRESLNISKNGETIECIKNEPAILVPYKGCLSLASPYGYEEWASDFRISVKPAFR
ncbi:MAG: SEL1-like repeat protein [Prevotella sp.]|nr:SEL1-like repeat protein [Prevotella sp.]